MTETTPIGLMAMMTERFNRDVIGLPIPDRPTRLKIYRKEYAVEHLVEELNEFDRADKLEDEVDALVDLTYVALGRLIEMGICPLAAFEEVHQANMLKRRGTKDTRPNTGGYDAVKPGTWTPPDIAAMLAVTRDDVEYLANQRAAAEEYEGHESCADEPGPYSPQIVFVSPSCKVLIIGHARHGKDTVGEILRDRYGLSFTSSSMFCAERVLWPLIHDAGVCAKFLGSLPEDKKFEHGMELKRMYDRYASAAECFMDRSNHRALWFDAISWFNTPDKSALGRAIFEENDVYVGLRSKQELQALVNVGVPDVVVWVDRSDQLPPEDKSSCTVEPWMADYVVDNNGSLEDLERNVVQLFDRLMGDRT